jgi:hypothetical protein
MFYRLRRAFQYRRAHRDFARILATPPVSRRDDRTIILSQVQHRDLQMYLVAAKSLAHHNRVSRFHVIDDGSLTAHDHALLGFHLPGVTITPIAAHSAASPVQGGTWERLTAVAALAESDYVVQLDSDTVTLGPLAEVLDCIHQRRSFAMMSAQDSQILPLAAVAERARRFSSRHIQVAAEQCLDALDRSIGVRYAIATSAFAGFAPSPDRAQRLQQFSRAMAARLHARWAEWGSEQVSSNFLVACDPQAVLLPYRRYRNFDGNPLEPECTFVHFFGTYRFDADVYRSVARGTAALLGASASQPPVLAAAAR